MSMVAFYTWLIFMEISLFASLLTPPGLRRQPEPFSSSRVQQARSSVQGSGHLTPARQSKDRQGPKPSTTSLSRHGSTDVRVAMPCAGIAGASTGSDTHVTPKAKHCTRASKISSDKRAFRRAQRRVVANGSTMYRGFAQRPAWVAIHLCMRRTTSSMTSWPIGFNRPENNMTLLCCGRHISG